VLSGTVELDSFVNFVRLSGRSNYAPTSTIADLLPITFRRPTIVVNYGLAQSHAALQYVGYANVLRADAVVQLTALFDSRTVDAAL
jgi:hypothetical protein